MILLRPSFLVMILSTCIILEPTLGAESNDKLDTLLSYMVRMSDDIKLLNQKVDGVQKEIIEVEKKVEKVDRDTSSGWFLIADAHYKTCDEDHFYKDHVSLGECMEHCYQYREENGRDWNGLLYNEGENQRCSCQKNSRGYVPEARSQWRLYRVA